MILLLICCRTGTGWRVAPPDPLKGVEMRLSSYLDVAISELLRLDAPDAPPPVQSTDYDTSWAARLTGPDERPSHPELLEYLAEKQRPDGSWGTEIPHAHDRLLSTLSVILLLAKHGSRQRDREKLRAGEHYVWQSVMWLRQDPQRTVGFELILPTLLAEARELGLRLPSPCLPTTSVSELRNSLCSRATGYSILKQAPSSHSKPSLAM